MSRGTVSNALAKFKYRTASYARPIDCTARKNVQGKEEAELLQKLLLIFK